MRKLIGVVSIVSFGLLGCGAEDHPKLPPKDSMVLPSFGGSSTALTQAGTNYGVAALSVGLVTLTVGAVLAPPQLLFNDLLNTTPKKEGSEWLWKKTYPALNNIEGTLHGSLSDKLALAMHVDGTYQGVSMNDFVWFKGEHTVTNGFWDFYIPEQPANAVLRIDWSVLSSTDKDLTFTNIAAGDPALNDKITYSLKGSKATMSLHDEHSGSHLAGANANSAPSDFSVQWDTADGSGKMTSDSGSVCWSTTATGQANITCP